MFISVDLYFLDLYFLVSNYATMSAMIFSC